MSETSTYNPNRTRRALAAGSAALVLLTGVAVKTNERINKKVERHFDKTEQEAFQNVTMARNSVVVLHEGVRYRTAPLTINPDTAGEPTTRGGQVEQGEVLRLDRPLVYTDNDNAVWYGFISIEKGPMQNNANPERVYWVNFSELQSQSSNDSPYIEIYNYHGVSPTELTVNVDANGNFVGSAGNKGGLVGLASSMPAANFEQMVVEQQLTLAS